MIRRSSEVFNQAKRELKDYQIGRRRPSKSRFPVLNENQLGGQRPGSIRVLGGTSGAGKSYLAAQLKRDFLNNIMNPQADNSIIIEYQWEMTPLNMLLRDLSYTTSLGMSEIMSRQFTREEKVMAAQTSKNFDDPRSFMETESCTPIEWEMGLEEFLKDNLDKDHIEVQIDHIALTKNGTFRDKKAAMDYLIEAANSLKKRYTNTSFTILTQLNRAIDDRKDPKNCAPLKSDIYGSDTIYHIADLVMVVDVPYMRGIDRYMVVRPEDGRYSHLQKYMQGLDSQVTNFHSEGLIFHHYLKIRMQDSPQNTKLLDVVEMYKGSWQEEPVADDGRIRNQRGSMDAFM